MKSMHQRPTDKPRRRSGLAPLELVLALPMMLFAMGLMVNIGTVGAWKVRAQANVRNAAWRTLHLRSGDSNPNPAMWPTNAAVNGGGGSDVTQVDQIWNGDQDLATPSVRGPAVTEPTQGMSIVVNPMLEMSDGVHNGSAPLQRQIPFLRGILPNDGQYNLNLGQNVLDGNWEYHNINFNGQGYSRNNDQRLTVLYDIEQSDFPSVVTLRDRTRRTQAEIQNPANYSAPGSPVALSPLDEDYDLSQLSLLPPRLGQNQSPNSSGPPEPFAPDLYPGRVVIRACLADPSMLRTSQQFSTYLRQIRRLPRTTANTFRRWYQDRLDYLQQQMPPLPNSNGEMQQLQDEIDLIDQFLGALPPQI